MKNKALFSFGPGNHVYLRAKASSLGELLPYDYSFIFPSEVQERRRDHAPVRDYCVCGQGSQIVYLWQDKAGNWFHHLEVPEQLRDWLLGKDGPPEPVKSATDQRQKSSKGSESVIVREIELKSGEQWLTREVGTLHIAIGALGSFYAHDENHWTSSRLPAALQRLIDADWAGNESKRRPLCVALGAGGSWVYIDAKMNVHKHLPAYPVLDRLLETNHHSGPCYISLNANEGGQFFAAFARPPQNEPSCRFRTAADRKGDVWAFAYKNPAFASIPVLAESSVIDYPSEAKSPERQAVLPQHSDSWHSDPRTPPSSGSSTTTNSPSKPIELQNLRDQFRAQQLTIATLQAEKAALERRVSILEAELQNTRSGGTTQSPRPAHSSGDLAIPLASHQQKQPAQAQAQVQVQAQAMLQANAVANRDFTLRQRLQAQQYMQQSQLNAMQNMSTMASATIANIAWAS